MSRRSDSGHEQSLRFRSPPRHELRLSFLKDLNPPWTVVHVASFVAAIRSSYSFAALEEVRRVDEGPNDKGNLGRRGDVPVNPQSQHTKVDTSRLRAQHDSCDQ